jgi:hypothetical protein
MIETEHLSDLRLDELLVGERPDHAAYQHLATCGECRARRDELAADRAQFLAAPPPLPARRPPPRPAPARISRRTRWLASGGLVAAAAIVLFVAPLGRGGSDVTPAGDAGETRTKGGGGRLGVIVEHRGEQRAALPGEVVHPGDTLVFEISTPRPTHVAVLGRDARGSLHIYFPSGPAAEALGAGADQPLPLATVLDESLGAERLIAAFCERPVPVAALRDAPEAAPPGCAFDVFAIEKVP